MNVFYFEIERTSYNMSTALCPAIAQTSWRWPQCFAQIQIVRIVFLPCPAYLLLSDSRPLLLVCTARDVFAAPRSNADNIGVVPRTILHRDVNESASFPKSAMDRFKTSTPRTASSVMCKG
jgi:hypothetical protein